ncbi:MAG: Flp pilus assembly protein CpaB [Anaerolineae bacterium]|jgi:Flp pilus assembly protein CpaB
MKRRSWLWFVVSGVLAVGAGALAILVLREPPPDGNGSESGSDGRHVVVASNAIAAGSVIRADSVQVAPRPEEEIPNGAMVSTEGVVPEFAARDIAPGQIVTADDIASDPKSRDLDQILGSDKIAVALPADDILSQWGSVLPGDHVDVLFTLDVILETPMYPEEIIAVEEGEVLQRVERDQSLDNISVLTLQNLEVLWIIEEPETQPEETRGQEEEEGIAPRGRALVLEADPQDAVVLKYIRDSEGIIDLVLRSPTNGTLFDVEPVNVNYLMLRYGILLPEPLD